jgi:hypothetical protein
MRRRLTTVEQRLVAELVRPHLYRLFDLAADHAADYLELRWALITAAVSKTLSYVSKARVRKDGLRGFMHGTARSTARPLFRSSTGFTKTAAFRAATKKEDRKFFIGLGEQLQAPNPYLDEIDITILALSELPGTRLLSDDASARLTNQILRRRPPNEVGAAMYKKRRQRLGVLRDEVEIPVPDSKAEGRHNGGRNGKKAAVEKTREAARRNNDAAESAGRMQAAHDSPNGRYAQRQRSPALRSPAPSR